MRLVVDASVLRRPHTGIARWVAGLTAALAASPAHEVIEASGPRRLGRGGLLYRAPNLIRQRWWYEAGLANRARAFRADAILGPANFAARRSNIPQTVTLTDVNFLAAPGTYEPAVVEYLTRVFRHAVANADALTTLSKHSRSALARHFGIEPEAISVVYPGLEPAPTVTESESPNGGRPYALYVGATEVHKNLDTLLNAWRLDSPLGLDLVFVGQPGRAHASLADRARGTEGRVSVKGAVDQSELERWYAHAEVFVFPSLSEGFGYPPLEAMLRGIPVVASRAGSLPEVLGDAALFHAPRDPEEIRQRVIEVVTDAELHKALIECGRSRAALYTWDRTVDAMDGAIKRAIAARS